jgi:hypothetical protein
MSGLCSGGVQFESQLEHGQPHWDIHNCPQSLQINAPILAKGSTASFHILSTSLFTDRRLI